MLSLIQSPSSVSSEREDLSKEQRKELNVLDALSALMVRQHEIVAVMSNKFNGSGVEVLAYVNHSEPALNIPQQTEGSKSWHPLTTVVRVVLMVRVYL